MPRNRVADYVERARSVNGSEQAGGLCLASTSCETRWRWLFVTGAVIEGMVPNGNRVAAVIWEGILGEVHKPARSGHAPAADSFNSAVER